MEQDNLFSQRRGGVAQQMQMFAEDVAPIDDNKGEDVQIQEKVASMMKDIRSKCSSPMPPSMLETAETYANRKVPELQRILKDAGISSIPIPEHSDCEFSTADGFVVADYVCTLSGFTRVTASEEVIEAVVNAVSDVEAVSFDAYGFHFGVYARYKLIAETNRRLRAAGDDSGKRQDVLKDVFSGCSEYYPAIEWLIQRNKIGVTDFYFTQTSEAVRLIESAKRYSEIHDFILAYCIAKGAYYCDGRELSEIQVPEFAKDDKDSLMAEAERTDTELMKMYQAIARMARTAADIKSTPQQREEAVAHMTQMMRYPKIISEINKTGIAYYEIPPKNDNVMKTDWQQINPITVRIQKELEEMKKLNEIANSQGKHYPTSLTTYNVALAIEAIPLLANLGKAAPVTIDKELTGYLVKTNLSEFSQACTQYKDTNMNEKLMYYHALSVLDGLWVAVMKPNGKMKPCRLLAIKEHPTPNDGSFEIIVFNSFWFALNSAANIIDSNLYRRLRQSEKSEPELRLRNLITDGTRSITEANLMDVVFGYSYKRKSIEARYRTVAQSEMLKLKSKEIQQVTEHIGRDKKKLQRCIDNLVESGAIKYTTEKTKDGKDMYCFTKLSGFDKTEGLIKKGKKKSNKQPKDGEK